ncbi:MAG: hypothetical protein M3069_16205 [Chloroflexota bacterium]|nr:hypothetical protein [Chloroflexota bacterium]
MRRPAPGDRCRLTFGPDGNLYISNHGFGPLGTTSGQILKAVLNDDGADD